MEQPTPHPLVEVTDVLASILDEIEAITATERDATPTDLAHVEPRAGTISTGMPEVDEVLGGGLVPGQVLVIEATDPRLANSLAGLIARQVEQPTLLSVTDARQAVRDMVEATGRLRAGALAGGDLSEDEWATVSRAVTELVDDAPRLIVGVHPDQLSGSVHDVVVILDGDRFMGRPSGVRRMHRFADRTQAAVVVAAVAGRGLGPLVTPGLRVLQLVAFPEGPVVTATLLDDEEWPVEGAEAVLGYDSVFGRILVDPGAPYATVGDG